MPRRIGLHEVPSGGEHVLGQVVDRRGASDLGRERRRVAQDVEHVVVPRHAPEPGPVGLRMADTRAPRAAAARRPPTARGRRRDRGRGGRRRRASASRPCPGKGNAPIAPLDDRSAPRRKPAGVGPRPRSAPDPRDRAPARCHLIRDRRALAAAASPLVRPSRTRSDRCDPYPSPQKVSISARSAILSILPVPSIGILDRNSKLLGTL